jgi:hypothetical protein
MRYLCLDWRYDYRPSDEEINKVVEKAGGLKGLVIPASFVQNVTPYNPKGNSTSKKANFTFC